MKTFVYRSLEILVSEESIIEVPPKVGYNMQRPFKQLQEHFFSLALPLNPISNAERQRCLGWFVLWPFNVSYLQETNYQIQGVTSPHLETIHIYTFFCVEKVL